MVAFNTALGPLAISTSASQTQLTWIVDGYTVMLACLLLPAGAIGDRYGRRAALLCGMTVFAIASVSPAVFDSPPQIIAARMVAGIGAAFVMPATLSLMTSAYPHNERAKAIGIWAGVAGCAGVLGMLGSGALLHFSDWRTICWTFAGAALLVAVAARAVPASRNADAPPVDWVGAVLIAAAAAVTVTGLLHAPHHGWASPLTLGCLAAGLACGSAFVLVERKRRWPLVDVGLFADQRFAAGVATILVLFAATFGFFYLAMQYVQLIMGYSALMTAVAFIPFVFPVVGLSALSFYYTPRLGLRRVLAAGLLLIAAGFLTMFALQRGSAYLHAAMCIVVIGCGIGLCTAPATSAIMAGVGEERQGIGSAINDAARELGAALGIALAGSVLAHRYTRGVAPDVAAQPQFIRSAVTDSLGQALHVAQLAGRQGVTIIEQAQNAFVAAMQSSATVLAIGALAAAVFIGLRAPRR